MINFKSNNALFGVIKSLLFLTLLCVIVFFNWGVVQEFFHSSVALNSLIIGFFGFAVLYIVLRFVVIFSEENVLSKLHSIFLRVEKNELPETEFLAELHKYKSKMISDRVNKIIMLTRQGFSIDTQEVLVDALVSEEENRRSLTRYVIGILIFLGLLGTFWGLLITISGVREVIKTLALPAGGDVTRFVLELQGGLDKPLSGMATAFSTSFFGLAASIVAGFFEIQLNMVTVKYVNKLEEFVIVHLIPFYSMFRSVSEQPATASGGEDFDKRLKAASMYIQGSQEAIGANIEAVALTMEKVAAGWNTMQQTTEKLLEAKERESAAYGNLSDELKHISERMERQGAGFERVEKGLIAVAEEITKLSVKIGEFAAENRTMRTASTESFQEIVMEFRKETQTLGRIISHGIADISENLK